MTAICQRGHGLAGNNLYVHPNGALICKECRKGWSKSQRSRYAAREFEREGSKVCPGCGTELPTSAFGKSKSSSIGLQTRCKECRAQYSSNHWQKTKSDPTVQASKSRARRKFNLAQFGLTEQQYDGLLARQNGVCAICCKPERSRYKGTVRRLAVDHDRSCCPFNGSCGKCVRGLLCRACNQGLGQFEDNPSALARAVAYLASRTT